MALTTGTKLGPYEIVSPLGAGGMGEVYRARDTRLERTVAVKILPAHLSDNPEAKQRFEREARAISSLSHSNICPLYDVGRQDGIDFIVMEFLEGETLADRLRKGPLAPEQVLKHGIEICEGLQKAHRSGVIHRDLKPGNIMLTKSGAKLMDFGLAKAPVAAATVGSPSDSLETMSRPLTAAGTIVGTFQYMSPEQVQGKEADPRSDVFSLGAVLYEMVTGNRAFEGKTTASTIAAILAAEPKPISVVQPMSPPALEAVVKACLAKDPDERLQTAHDVKLQLQWITNSPGEPGLAVRHDKTTRFWMAATIVLLLAVAALTILYLMRPKVLQQHTVRFSFPRPDSASIRTNFAFSPDGTILAFIATNQNGIDQIWTRSMDSDVAQPIDGTGGASFPFWSPDGRRLGFFTHNKLKIISLSGGAAQDLCDVNAGRGAAWGPDGAILFTPDYESALFRTLDSGCDMHPVTTLLPGQDSHRWPTFLPDGKHFLFLAPHTKTGGDVYVGSLDKKALVRLTTANSFATYVDPGLLVFAREQALLAQAFDPKNLRMSGDPVTLGESVSVDPTVTGSAAFAASRNGNVAFRGVKVHGIELAWFDRSGTRVSTLGQPGQYQEPALSHDGTRLAIVRDDDIVIINNGSGATSRVTFQGAAWGPTWSPDDTRILFTSASSGRAQIYEKSVSETRDPKLLFQSDVAKNMMDWSADGRYITFDNVKTGAKGSGSDTYVVPLFGERKPIAFQAGDFNEGQGRFSPDGRWMVYCSRESGRIEVFATSFPSGAGKIPISVNGGSEPIWNSNGKEIFYLASDRKLMSVALSVVGDTLQPKPPVALFTAPIVRLGDARNHYVPSKDGKRFLVLAEPRENLNAPVNVVLNFPASMKHP